jgi:hypothetical protein
MWEESAKDLARRCTEVLRKVGSLGASYFSADCALATRRWLGCSGGTKLINSGLHCKLQRPDRGQPEPVWTPYRRRAEQNEQRA